MGNVNIAHRMLFLGSSAAEQANGYRRLERTLSEINDSTETPEMDTNGELFRDQRVEQCLANCTWHINHIQECIENKLARTQDAGTHDRTRAKE